MLTVTSLYPSLQDAENRLATSQHSVEDVKQAKRSLQRELWEAQDGSKALQKALNQSEATERELHDKADPIFNLESES